MTAITFDRPSPAVLRILRQPGAAPPCPDCDYLMIPIDRCRDACVRCGQIVVNEQRVLRHLIATFGATHVVEQGKDDHAEVP